MSLNEIRQAHLLGSISGRLLVQSSMAPRTNTLQHGLYSRCVASSDLPALQATKGKQRIDFFTIPEYEQWLEDTPDVHKWDSKYYKVCDPSHNPVFFSPDNSLAGALSGSQNEQVFRCL